MYSYRINPDTLRIFLVTARTLNLTQTAEEVFMTLSAVSKRISELEHQVGCQLFTRKARGLELTLAGHALIEHAQHILFNFDKLTMDMRAFSKGEKGLVTLWANTSAIIQFLPQDLQLFSSQYPDIKIELEERHSQDIIGALNQNKINLGIFAHQIQTNQLETVLYRQDQLVILTPLDHALAKYDSIDFEETLTFDFVGLPLGSSLHQIMHETAINQQINLKFRVQVNSFDAICRMVAIGLGIGVLPLNSISYGMIGEQLHIVKINNAWANRKLFLGMNKQVKQTPEALNLFQFLQQQNNRDFPYKP